MIFFVLFAFAFVFVLYYFGFLGFFKLLHVQFDSLFALFLFVIWYLLIGIIGDLIIKLVRRYINVVIPVNVWKFFSTFLLIYFINWMIILLLYNSMESIKISGFTQMLASVIISFVELAFEKPEKKGNSHTDLY
ncbi:YrvL family regulatory protein [Niallia sp. 03133]|uniref:YrvL family regulatory protein n=1 Tax=Niallia sp. 03133 TaxID=3458060 RepID=UPI004044B5AE